MLGLFTFGCEEAAVGARCENVYDCDRTGAGSTRGCFSYANPNIACAPGVGNSCVCCPNVALRTNLSELPVACQPRGGNVTDVPTVLLDATVMDAQDSGGADGATDSGVLLDVPNTPTDRPNPVLDVPNAPVDVPNAPVDIPDPRDVLNSDTVG